MVAREVLDLEAQVRFLVGLFWFFCMFVFLHGYCSGIRPVSFRGNRDALISIRVSTSLLAARVALIGRGPVL